MNVKRNIFAWYLYDFAVSGFTTSVLTVFIGPYLTTITKNASVNGYVNILGISIYAGSFVPYVISLSVILQVFLLPYFAAIGNNSGKKTFFFQYFGYNRCNFYNFNVFLRRRQFFIWWYFIVNIKFSIWDIYGILQFISKQYC